MGKHRGSDKNIFDARKSRVFANKTREISTILDGEFGVFDCINRFQLMIYTLWRSRFWLFLYIPGGRGLNSLE
jgi:hypothetical protein